MSNTRLVKRLTAQLNKVYNNVQKQLETFDKILADLEKAGEDDGAAAEKPARATRASKAKTAKTKAVAAKKEKAAGAKAARAAVGKKTRAAREEDQDDGDDEAPAKPAAKKSLAPKKKARAK